MKDTPQGAGGLEWAFDKTLAGTNGAYDASLRLDERVKRATPAPGADVRGWLDLRQVRSGDKDD